MLASLTPREERVLRMRFGIGMNTDHTLEEVGQQFSVTRERIRQIEAKALRKLKHPSRSRGSCGASWIVDGAGSWGSPWLSGGPIKAPATAVECALRSTPLWITSGCATVRFAKGVGP